MKRIILISITLAVLLGTACDDSAGPGSQGVMPVDNISNLEVAFNNRDIALFGQQLTNDFTFVFNLDDVGEEVNGYTIPETWYYEHIHRAASNLFGSGGTGGAYDISLQLPESDIGDPPEGAREYTAPDIQISLLVMFDENNGIIVNYGTLNLTFVNIPAGGTDQWFIAGLEDFTFAKKGIESASLGWVLAMFYAGNPL